MQDRIFLLVNIACPFSQVNSNLQRLVENTVQQKATFVLDHSFTKKKVKNQKPVTNFSQLLLNINFCVIFHSNFQ